MYIHLKPGYCVICVAGYFPLGPTACVVWATSDVFLCTASIWHMATMSVDRYISIRCPLRYNGRARTKRSVVLRIAFVWFISALVCAALPVTAVRDLRAVYSPGDRPRCVPAVREFVVYGSIFAFYIPLSIMVVAYALTVRRLRRNRSTIGRYRTESSQQKRPTTTKPTVGNGVDVVRGR